jgi:hypothetical protein
MRLPFLENAVVEEGKVTAYLLSEKRSEGKAAFFAAFGFTRERWDLLRDALPEHGASHEVFLSATNPYGVKYIIEGPLRTPDARSPRVRSVWILATGSSAPRLVTAYPLQEDPDDPRA